MANAVIRAGDSHLGDALFAQALIEYRKLGDVRGIARMLMSLCVRATYAGDFDQAQCLGEEALGHLRTLADTGATAEVLWSLGLAAHGLGQDDRAVILCEESLALRRDRGDERNAAKTLATLGIGALNRGDTVRARTQLCEALASLRAYADRHGQAIVLTFLGHVALAEGDLAEAEARLTESVGLFRAVGNPLWMPWYLEGLAGLAAERGRWEQASRLCGAMDALRAAFGFGLLAADPAGYARRLAQCREALGGRFDGAYARGRAQSSDEALAEPIPTLQADDCPDHQHDRFPLPRSHDFGST
jgi:tetratricopeptide (TPR) repeat protein